MTKTIALAGNPNSGKTTLFNRLTGTRQVTGNWPGVTVEKKTGDISSPLPMCLVDLPGLYSIASFAAEEVVARDFIMNDRPDVVVNIIDATNLERNLYLTLQLRKLGCRLIVALNMMDELLSHGDTLDVDRLSTLLELPVVPISARSGEGVDTLLQRVAELAAEPFNESSLIAWQKETPEETQRLYDLATDIHAAVLVHSHSRGALSLSDRIDRLLTHRVLAFPLFLLLMFVIFYLTFSEKIGGFLGKWFSERVADLGALVAQGLTSIGTAPWLTSLVVDGAIAGVGGILAFLPQIIILFFFLTILEDSGYLARTAFITDRLFREIGLTGHSFIPMILGFGCTVPAIMAARGIENERDRRLTVLITPFMSCSARMPIYALLSQLFFSRHAGLIVFGLYVFGILVALLSAFILNKVLPGQADHDFVLELPPYRVPYTKSLLLHIWDKISDFVRRAGTIIFLMSIIIWFLNNFTFSLTYIRGDEPSILYTLSQALTFLFVPLGFGRWQAVSALFSGLIAKESLVSSLNILLPGEQLATFFSPLSAASFLVFVLLYTPCVAAIAATAREMRSRTWTIGAIFWQTGLAYILGLLVYQIGSLFV